MTNTPKGRWMPYDKQELLKLKDAHILALFGMDYYEKTYAGTLLRSVEDGKIDTPTHYMIVPTLEGQEERDKVKEQIIKRLEQLSWDAAIEGPSLSELTEIQSRINQL